MRAILDMALAAGGLWGGADEPQLSFASGEISPTLHGRVDLQRYLSALRRCRNFIPLPHGPVMNRAGTQHVAHLDFDVPVRVIPFVYSATDSKVLAVRKLELGGGVTILIANVWGPGSDTRYSFAMSAIGSQEGFDESDVFAIRHAQLGNQMMLVSNDGGILKLTRESATVWSFEEADFSIPEAPELTAWGDGLPVLEEGNYAQNVSYGTPPTPSTITAYLDHNFPHVVIDGSDPDEDWRGVGQVQPGEASNIRTEHTLNRILRGFTFEGGGVSDDPDNWWTEDDTHPARPWSWLVTYIVRRADGSLYESQGTAVTQGFFLGRLVGVEPDPDPFHDQGSIRAEGPFEIPAKIAIYADMVRTIATGTQAGNTTEDGETIVAARLYRGREGRFGFIGETTGPLIDDDGALPDFSNPPPQGQNPFESDYPSVVAYFQSRLLLAATTAYPNRIHHSALDDFLNFDEVTPPDDADALFYDIVSERNEIIRALVPGKPALALTSGGIYPLIGSGDQNNILTPNSLPSLEATSEVGCADLHAVRGGGAVFYSAARGGRPMLVRQDEGYQAVEAALLATHLFKGYSIVDWAFQENPWPILWVVRSDGRLLSLTYLKEQEVMAWAWHDLCDEGLVESVAVVPEGEEDGVYFVVNRDDERYLERFARRLYPLTPDSTADDEVPDVRHAVIMDRAASYNGKRTATIIFSTGGTPAVGGTITITSISGAGATYDGATIQIDDADGGQPWRLQLASVGGDSYTALVLNRNAADLEGETFTSWWLCATSIGGLSHLEGEEVVVNADGNVIRGKTVAGGAVDLSDVEYGGVAIAHAGRPFTSELITLDAIQEKGRQKIVKKVRLELEHSRGGEVGQVDTTAGVISIQDQHMAKVPVRDVGHAYLPAPLVRQEVPVIISGSWNKGGAIAYRQEDPMPVTVIGLTREVEYGGK